MRASDPLRQRVLHNLKAAMDRIDPDFDRVEFWAAALEGLLQPVPSYEPHRGEFMLPPQNGADERLKPAGRRSR